MVIVVRRTQYEINGNRAIDVLAAIEIEPSTSVTKVSDLSGIPKKYRVQITEEKPVPSIQTTYFSNFTTD